MPQPPDDSPETCHLLHAAIRAFADEDSVLNLITRGADPSRCQEGKNAYGLARSLGYPETFCQKMGEAFSHRLTPLADVRPIYVTRHAKALFDTLKNHGWTVWCQGSGQLGAFAWFSSYRVYLGSWVMEAHEGTIYGHVEISLGLPKDGFEDICRLLDGYGVVWALEMPPDE